jgi:predicted O-linked N-acetylglucosamine transferase (SPINDLY family)
MKLKQEMQKAVELFTCGKTKESLDAFRKLYLKDPDNQDLTYNYAFVLGELGKIKEEIELYDILLKKSLGNNYDVLINKSIALMELKDLDLAHSCALEATQKFPTRSEAWEILGDIEYAKGEILTACNSYQSYFKKIIDESKRPILENFINTSISLLNLPGIYDSTNHIDSVRKKFIENLSIAYEIAKLLPMEVFQENKFGPKLAFKINTFYLAYQQQDDQLLNRKLVKLYQILLGERELVYKSLPTTHSQNRKKVLVISTFKYHPELFIFNQIKGFVDANYELHCYVVNSAYQPTSLDANYLKLKFNPDNYKDVIHFIQNQKFDFVFMPDIGMSIESRILSTFKLGEKTFMNWLHPISSGSPYIDYFLSGELMEGNHSDDRYSERLIKLPGVGLNFEIMGGKLKEISYSEVDTFHIGCIQTPFKYHPDFDKVYPLLCLTNPKIKFHFFDYYIKKFTTQLIARLEKEFTKYGLVFEDHIVIHPRILSREKYLDHLAGYHLILDAQGWSGGNTTIDALNSGVPVLCLYKEDGDIRQKHTSSILKLLNLEECCFTNLDDLKTTIGSLMLPGKYNLLRNKFTNVNYKFSSCNMYDSIVNP